MCGPPPLLARGTDPSVGFPSPMPTPRCPLPPKSSHPQQQAVRRELTALRNLAVTRRTASARLSALRRAGFARGPDGVDGASPRRRPRPTLVRSAL